jgi:hypothetical protein
VKNGLSTDICLRVSTYAARTTSQMTPFDSAPRTDSSVPVFVVITLTGHEIRQCEVRVTSFISQDLMIRFRKLLNYSREYQDTIRMTPIQRPMGDEIMRKSQYTLQILDALEDKTDIACHWNQHLEEILDLLSAVSTLQQNGSYGWRYLTNWRTQRLLV